jgi:hypothetical protein
MQGSSNGEVCYIASSAGVEIVIFEGGMIVAYSSSIGKICHCLLDKGKGPY